MTFNTYGQYSANHKTWDHVGNLIPPVEHSEGVRPHHEFRPASWLPVQYYDKHYEQWTVIMPGKVVSCDPDGNLVPAGLKIAVELAGSGDVVTYTTDDVGRTTNVATGSLVTSAELTDAGSTRGYTAAEIDAAGFLGQSGVSISISAPIGVAPYAYLQWAGGDGFNPADYQQHNYNMQHQTAVLCDYVLQLPLVPEVATTEALSFGTPASNVSVSAALSNLPVAKNTARTAFTFAGGDSATLFVNEKDTASDVTASGDYHVDLTTGVITVYATSQPTSITLTYYHYASSPTTVSKYACAVGNLQCGDLLTFDADSNFRVANATTLYIGDTSSSDQSDEVARSHGLVIGQVIGEQTEPRSLLDRVRTSYSPALSTTAAAALPGTSGQLDQMPGTATGGARDHVHYAGAANKVVLVNLTRF